METLCKGAGLDVSKQIDKEPREQRPGLALGLSVSSSRKVFPSSPTHNSLFFSLGLMYSLKPRCACSGQATQVICFSLEVEPLAGKGPIVLLNLVIGT